MTSYCNGLPPYIHSRTSILQGTFSGLYQTSNVVMSLDITDHTLGKPWFIIETHCIATKVEIFLADGNYAFFPLLFPFSCFPSISLPSYFGYHLYRSLLILSSPSIVQLRFLDRWRFQMSCKVANALINYLCVIQSTRKRP